MQLEKLYLQLPGTIGNHQYLMSQVASGVDSIASACVQVERSLYAVRSELHAATCSGWQTIEQATVDKDFDALYKSLRAILRRLHMASCRMEKFPCTVKPHLARIHAHVANINDFATFIGSFASNELAEQYKQKVCGPFYT